MRTRIKEKSLTPARFEPMTPSLYQLSYEAKHAGRLSIAFDGAIGVIREGEGGGGKAGYNASGTFLVTKLH